MKVKQKKIGSNYQTPSPEVLSGYSNFQNFVYDVDQPFSHVFQGKVNTLKFTSEADAEIIV